MKNLWKQTNTKTIITLLDNGYLINNSIAISHEQILHYLVNDSIFSEIIKKSQLNNPASKHLEENSHSFNF